MHCHRDDENGKAREDSADSRTLRARRAAHDFRAATDADICALGNLRSAVWADEFFHGEKIAADSVSGEHFSRSVYRGDADARHNCNVARCQRLVSLRCGANPLYGEVLERHQQLAEIASRNFNFVVGKNEAQSFPLIRANEGSGDEMLKREDVKLAVGRF